MVFPEYRPRRMRQNENFRSMIRETHLAPSQLVYPLFVMPGKGKREEVSSMPGVFRISVDQLKEEAQSCLEVGVRSVILFGLPEKKDAMGSGAHAQNGIVQQAIKELKNTLPMIYDNVGRIFGRNHDHTSRTEFLSKPTHTKHTPHKI
ncbi:MAG: porphobilinogen synthase, partial [Candidatus Electrothrix sp. AW5]|nr:porphobilinogen synthase [Candidatus Electrothrix gigas]